MSSLDGNHFADHFIIHVCFERMTESIDEKYEPLERQGLIFFKCGSRFVRRPDPAPIISGIRQPWLEPQTYVPVIPL